MNKWTNKQTSKQGDKRRRKQRDVNWKVGFSAWDGKPPQFLQHCFPSPSLCLLFRLRGPYHQLIICVCLPPDSTVLQTVSLFITVINKPIMWNKNTVGFHLNTHCPSHKLFQAARICSSPLFCSSYRPSASLFWWINDWVILEMHYAW